MASIRGLRASIVTFVACLVFTVGLSVPAYAAPKWCEDDPIITIDSAWAQIVTKFDASYLGTITGPIAYEIYVPDFALAQTQVYLPPSLVVKTVNVYALPAGYWPDWSSPDKVKIEVRMFVPATAAFATLSNVSGSFGKAFQIRSASNTLTNFRISLH